MSNYNRATDRDGRGRLKRTYRRPSHTLSTPGWWVRVHMNRPRRRANRELCRLMALGHDPDAINLPLGNRKPHVYYW